MDFIKIAKRIIIEESDALRVLSKEIPTDFPKVIDHISSFNGRVVLTGIGKSGYIAHKIASSFASTGTASFYLHPAEASHGDLGMITSEDLVIMFSNSGETKELINVINYCKRFCIKIVAVTMNKTSTLAKSSDFLLCIPTTKEASLVSAPTTSALMMLAIGDALTTAVQENKGFSKDDFRIYHPGGKIGINLLLVKDLMHVGNSIPLVHTETSFTETIITITQKRLGCAVVTNENNQLLGIITDGDLRVSLGKLSNIKKASDLMTINPKHISPFTIASEALFLMNNKSITVLPVVQDDIIVGILHIHDLIKAGV